MKKHVATPEEIVNDPSLKHVPYCLGEAVWADKLLQTVRFSHYADDGKIVVMDMVMRNIAFHMDPLTVRRSTY